MEIRPDNMTVLDVARRIAYALHRGMQAKKDAEIGRNGVSLGGAVRGDPASGVWSKAPARGGNFGGNVAPSLIIYPLASDTWLRYSVA